MTLSRRALLAGLAATPLLAACNASGTSAGQPGDAGGGAGPFRWQDARGKEIVLDAAPTSVVAQSSAAAALWDAGFQVTGAYGELKTTDGKLDYQAGNLDLSKVQVIGETFGDFSVEKLAALGPQLLIDMSFDNKTLWYVDAKLEKQVGALCPTLGMEMLKRDLVEVIGSFTQLAVALGADPAVSESAKAEFDAASAALKETIAKAGGVKVAALSFDASSAYVANAQQHPDLAYLTTLGAQFVDAKSKPDDYFSTISYEKLGDFEGDVIIVDARNADTSYRSQATYKALEAVKAGRVFAWKPAAPYSYKSSVPILQGFEQVWSTAGS